MTTGLGLGRRRVYSDVCTAKILTILEQPHFAEGNASKYFWKSKNHSADADAWAVQALCRRVGRIRAAST